MTNSFREPPRIAAAMPAKAIFLLSFRPTTTAARPAIAKMTPRSPMMPMISPDMFLSISAGKSRPGSRMKISSRAKVPSLEVAPETEGRGATGPVTAFLKKGSLTISMMTGTTASIRPTRATSSNSSLYIQIWSLAGRLFRSAL